MVVEVRKGMSQRSVAREYGVALSTVQFWLNRARGRSLDGVDWRDRPDGPLGPANRTSGEVEDLILDTRRYLRYQSDLGEYGALAIHGELRRRGGGEVPCARTIHRILERRGVLDARRRVRYPAPPPGWYLPVVGEGRQELDQYDIVEGLKIEDGPIVEVLTAISLHGGLVGAWPMDRVTSSLIRSYLVDHWLRWGLPGFAQFDNDTAFQGAHQHRDVISSVMRLCLSLGVIPVFVPPRETGFQGAIEAFNGQWQARAWARFHHERLEDLVIRSDKYVTAYRQRRATRQERAPRRKPFPPGWRLELQEVAEGQVMFLRRTNDRGEVFLLGRTFEVDSRWSHRLVRAEVNLKDKGIRFYALRRRAPAEQPLLNEVPYELPDRRFRE
jgi:putative transposase